MKVTIHEAAAADLDGILDWISSDNPKAAAELVRRIRARISRLATAGLSHIGRPGLVNGTRELVEPPYIIVYSVDEVAEQIVVLAIVSRSPESRTIGDNPCDKLTSLCRKSA